MATGPWPELTFFGGKGGVGKTTCAAAWALGRAAPDHRILLISTDPAHSLGDVLVQSLHDRPQAVTADLDALELAPEQALAHYIAEVKANLQELTSPELRSAAAAQVDLAAIAPGAADAALFEAMVQLILTVGPGYAELVFDTAPTGHTLQLLALPEVMREWTEGMLARRREARAAWLERAPLESPAEDRAAEILEARRQRFATVRERLTDTRRTRFVPVLNPDALSLEETRRMVRRLDEQGVPVPFLIVNRVLPDHADGEFMAALRKTQASYLGAISEAFDHRPRILLEHSPGEIRGVAALRALDLAIRTGAPVVGHR